MPYTDCTLGAVVELYRQLEQIYQQYYRYTNSDHVSTETDVKRQDRRKADRKRSELRASMSDKYSDCPSLMDEMSAGHLAEKSRWLPHSF